MTDLSQDADVIRNRYLLTVELKGKLEADLDEIDRQLSLLQQQRANVQTDINETKRIIAKSLATLAEIDAGLVFAPHTMAAE